VIVLDRLTSPALFAKAVGIQPRTLELWDSAGLARRALDAAVTLRGQIAYVNGAQVSRIDLQLPDAVPYRFVALPQYETERVLAESLAQLGTRVQRGVEVIGFSQGDTEVRSRPLCVKCLVMSACSCARDCGRCSPASRSFLPAPAARPRAGLPLDSACAPAGSAPIRSRPGCERPLSGGGSRVGLGPAVACPKRRSTGG